MVGLRHALMLVLSALMVATGVAGLAGWISGGPLLVVFLIAAAVGVAFSLGRLSVEIWPR